MHNRNKLVIEKQQAVDLLKSGMISKGRASFVELSRKYPKDWEVWNLLAAVHGMLEEFELCERCCRKALALNPALTGAWTNLGNALKFQNKLDEAEKCYKRVLRHDPTNPEAHNNLGTLYILHGNADAARQSFNNALHYRPDYADAIANLGKLAQDENNTIVALRYLQKAAALQPANPELQYNLGCILSAVGRNENAIDTFQRLLQMNPTHARGWSSLGYTYCIAGKFDKSLEACRHALKLRPDLADAHFTLGSTLQSLGHINEAIEAYRTALHHNPKLTTAKYFLATLNAEPIPDQSPADYISHLFNSCADRFENELVNTLGYRAPEQLFDAVTNLHELEESEKLDILDLGCGTGLCGQVFARHINTLVGVDLAPRMLEKAQALNLYTDLKQADVTIALREIETQFDLILSADVFIYIGKLDDIFLLARDRLKACGLFAFSIEVTGDNQDYKLGYAGRYAHSLAYIYRLSATTGFEVRIANPTVLRHEHGKPVDGNVIVLRRE